MDDLGQMIGAAAAGMSEPTAGAVAAINAGVPFGAANTETDAAPAPVPGRENFNPEIHDVDAAGFPKRTADGKRLAKKRGRKPKRRPPSAPIDADDADAAELAELAPVDPVEIRNRAVRMADFFFMGCAVAGPMIEPPPEEFPQAWAPSPEERDRVIKCLSDFYERYPDFAVDLPPGVALLGAVVMYVIPRVPNRCRQLAQLAGIPLPPAPEEIEAAPELSTGEREKFRNAA